MFSSVPTSHSKRCAPKYTEYEKQPNSCLVPHTNSSCTAGLDLALGFLMLIHPEVIFLGYCQNHGTAGKSDAVSSPFTIYCSKIFKHSMTGIKSPWGYQEGLREFHFFSGSFRAFGLSEAPIKNISSTASRETPSNALKYFQNALILSIFQHFQCCLSLWCSEQLSVQLRGLNFNFPWLISPVSLIRNSLIFLISEIFLNQRLWEHWQVYVVCSSQAFHSGLHTAFHRNSLFLLWNSNICSVPCPRKGINPGHTE